MTHYSQWFNMTSDRLSDFARVKVDVGQTSFFEGREFRMFKELNIPASGTYVIRATVPVNTILMSARLELDLGNVRVGTYVGGTPGGVFTDMATVFGVNNMTPGIDHRNDYPGIYVRQNVLADGGTHTGGTELDVVRLRTAANANQGGSAGVDPDEPRGIAPGTYYFRLQNLSATDIATGTFKIRWEERP